MSEPGRPRSDAELLSAYRRGDLDAFTAIYRRHGHKLFFYARALVGAGDLAENLVQEAFLRLLRTDIDDRDPSLGPFLFTVVRNLAADDRRHDAVRDRARPALAADARETAATAELKTDMKDLMDLLPADQREVVILKIYAGLTFDQIRELTQVKVPTLASRYSSALQRLGDALTERKAP